MDLDTWDLRIFSATADGGELLLNHAVDGSAAERGVRRLPLRHEIQSVGQPVGGYPHRDIARVCPPAPDATHVLIWADFGYSSNVSMANFLAPTPSLPITATGCP